MSGEYPEKLIIVHRYFWPQNYPYATMLKSIADALGNKTRVVEVLTTSTGNVEETNLRTEWAANGGPKVSSLKLGSEKELSLFRKAINAIYYSLWLLIRLLKDKPDVVMIATTPPVLSAFIVRVAAKIKRFRYVYHCQDIHPEAMCLNGNISKGLVYRCLRRIDKGNVDKAWKVITLSQDMKNTFEKRGCNVDHIHVINNFIFKSQAFESEAPSKDKVTFLFAGSLGRLQNLEKLIESLVRFKRRSDVEFIFMGDGVLRNKLESLKNRHGLNNVTFLGQKPLDDAVVAMDKADFGIVSLAPKICSVAYPSKTMMYLGRGLPVIALVDEGSDIYKFINGYDLGKAVAPLSTQIIADAIEALIAKQKKDPYERSHVAKIANVNFGIDVKLREFRKVFDL